MKVCQLCGDKYLNHVDFCFVDGEVLVVADAASEVTAPPVSELDAPMPRRVQGAQQAILAAETARQTTPVTATPRSSERVSTASTEEPEHAANAMTTGLAPNEAASQEAGVPTPPAVATLDPQPPRDSSPLPELSPARATPAQSDVAVPVTAPVTVNLAEEDLTEASEDVTAAMPIRSAGDEVGSPRSVKLPPDLASRGPVHVATPGETIPPGNGDADGVWDSSNPSGQHATPLIPMTRELLPVAPLPAGIDKPAAGIDTIPIPIPNRQASNPSAQTIPADSSTASAKTIPAESSPLAKSFSAEAMTPSLRSTPGPTARTVPATPANQRTVPAKTMAPKQLRPLPPHQDGPDRSSLVMFGVVTVVTAMVVMGFSVVVFGWWVIFGWGTDEVVTTTSPPPVPTIGFDDAVTTVTPVPEEPVPEPVPVAEPAAPTPAPQPEPVEPDVGPDENAVTMSFKLDPSDAEVYLVGTNGKRIAKRRMTEAPVMQLADGYQFEIRKKGYCAETVNWPNPSGNPDSFIVRLTAGCSGGTVAPAPVPEPVPVAPTLVNVFVVVADGALASMHVYVDGAAQFSSGKPWTFPARIEVGVGPHVFAAVDPATGGVVATLSVAVTEQTTRIVIE